MAGALNSGKIAALPTGLALPVSLLFVLAMGALTEFAVYRPLRNSAPLAKLVASLGVLLVAQAPSVLRVTGLSVAFGGLHALSDVTLEVRDANWSG